MPALLDSRQWKKMKDEFYAATGEDAWWLKGTPLPNTMSGSGGAIRIMKPKPEVVQKWHDDIAACSTCNRHEDNPVAHGTTRIFKDGSLYTYQCRSGSRAINPTTGELVGHAHCTCDYCY